MSSLSHHHHSNTNAGLGLDIDSERRPLFETSKSSSSSSEEGETLIHDQQETPRTVQNEIVLSHRKPQQIVRTKSVDLDTALRYISQSTLDSQSQERDGRINARRRGRAIYLNDLLQYDRKVQAKEFHASLTQWRNGRGDGGEMGKEEDDDVMILLAQARSLAQSSTHLGIDSPSVLKRQDDFKRQKSSRRQRNKPHFDLQTSASTPEGALGKCALPNVAYDFGSVNWDKEEADYSDEEYHEDKDEDEVNVLRAGLRFAIGCYDELIKKGRSGSNEDLSDRHRRNHREQHMDSDNLLQTPRSRTTRSRSRSIIKTLTKKGTSLTSDRNNRLSFQLLPGQESILDFDTASLDQVSGPSSRYGMANITPTLSPSSEQKSFLDQTSFTPKSLRHRSDSHSLASPLWTRRLSRLDTPSEETESNSDAVSVSHGNLASALQKMRKTKSSRQQSSSNVDEELRKERVMRAALERELETLKASFDSINQQQSFDADLSDIERGARSEEEQSMMVAVAQAARDTVEAEERQVEWKSQCGHLEERVSIVENALYQAMGLLAGKGDLHDGDDNTNLNRHLDEDSPFYSAGEEEQVDSSHESSASFMKIMSRYAKEKTPSPKQSSSKLEPHRDSMSKVSGSMLEESSLPSEDEIEHRDQNCDELTTSPLRPTVEANKSRRGSHTSWTRHSFLPPQLPLPISPLPTLPQQEQNPKGNLVSSRPTLEDNLTLSSPTVVVSPSSPTVADFSAEEKILNESVDVVKEDKLSKTKGVIDYSYRRKKRNDDAISRDSSTIESLPTLSVAGVLAASSPGNATLSAPFIFQDEEDHFTEEESERTVSSFNNTSIQESSSISRSRSSSNTTHCRRESLSDSMRSGTSQSTSIDTSSNGTKKKIAAKKNTKLSILGHMPPAFPSQRNPIPHSLSRSSSTLSLSISSSQGDSLNTSPIAEHYHRLDQPTTILDKIPSKATKFARRTRF